MLILYCLRVEGTVRYIRTIKVKDGVMKRGYRARLEYRVFRGDATTRVYGDGTPAQADRWYYEPVGYDHWQIWTESYPTREEAIEAAETDVELEMDLD